MKLILCLLLIAQQALAIKFFTNVVPAVAGLTTIAVNGKTLVEGIRRVPKTIKAVPKGPKAVVNAAKTPSKGKTK